MLKGAFPTFHFLLHFGNFTLKPKHCLHLQQVIIHTFFLFTYQIVKLCTSMHLSCSLHVCSNLYSCIHLFQANENNLFTELSETGYSVCIHYTQVILHHEIILPSTIGKGENRNLFIMYLTYLICLYILISTCIECKCVIPLLQFYLLLVLLIKKHRLLLHTVCLLIPTVQQFHICSLNYHWLAP